MFVRHREEFIETGEAEFVSLFEKHVLKEWSAEDDGRVARRGDVGWNAPTIT